MRKATSPATPLTTRAAPRAAPTPWAARSTTSFDRRGNLTLMVDAAGNATKVEYNALDLPTKLTDAMGGEWLRRYDERGNLIASTDPLGHTTLYEVDALGQVTAIIDALDKRKTLQWDEAGNLVAYTDCSGHTSRETYDALGHCAAARTRWAKRTDYVFDAAGQLQQVTQPDGATAPLHLGRRGQSHPLCRPSGANHRLAVQRRWRPLLRVDALGHTLRYQYDHAGRTGHADEREWAMSPVRLRPP